jgi:subtilisin family serine protease
MKTWQATLYASSIILALTFGAAAQEEATFNAPETPEVVPGEYIVKYEEGAEMGLAASALEDQGITVIDTLPLIGAQVVRIDASADALSLQAQAASLPGVEYIEPVYRVFALIDPSDTQYGQQWGFPKIKANLAWDELNDANQVVVAVIDTGVDYNHPDLTGNLWKNPFEIPANNTDDDNNGVIDDVFGANFVNPTTSGDPFDDNKHGTHVSGTIGAVTNNGAGVAGTSWKVKIMGLKFLAANGSGTTVGAIRAIEYGIKMEADIMNNSWGGGGFSQALADAIGKANDAGILFVAAAGNNNIDNDVTPFYPAGYNVANVVSVMATDQNDAKANFSHRGATSVDLAAPGVAILSTTPGNTFSTFNGTSMATPHVSGAAALLEAQDSTRDAAALKKLLMDTVDVIPALSGTSVTGGRLNLAKALEVGRVPGDPCVGGHARIAYNEFFWSSNLAFNTNSNILSVDFKLPAPMIIDISVDGSGRRVSGLGKTTFRTGVYDQPPANVMWTGSYRRGSFTANETNQTISSSFAIPMAAGNHTIYWKLWLTGEKIALDSGTLTVRAFPCSAGGKLVLSTAMEDSETIDPEAAAARETTREDEAGDSVTTVD